MADYKLEWIESGWTDDTEIVSSVLRYPQCGEQSGTIKLVKYAGGRKVAQVYFDPEGPPRITAWWTLKIGEPKP